MADAVVAEVEGFALALPPADGSSRDALELLSELAEVGPQLAFLGERSARLPASLNADFQSMPPISLRVVELIEAASDIVESVSAGSEPVVAGITEELLAIVRP
jgi:hypothetical protein